MVYPTEAFQGMTSARSHFANANRNSKSVLRMVEEYEPGLRQYLSRWLHSPDDVEDVLQDVFVRVLCYSDLNSVESAKAFVFVIAGNLLKDRNRRQYTQASKRTVTIESVELPSEVSDPARIFEARDELRKVDRVLARLRPKTKKAFLLHRLDGFSHKEIAQHMGVTTSMVEKHIMEGLKQLRHAFAT